MTASATRMPQATTMTTPRMIIRTIMPAIIMATVMATIVTMRTITTVITTTSNAVTTIITATPMLMKTNKPPGQRRNVVSDAAGPCEPPGLQSTGMPESEAAALYRLMTWLSPSFPVGAFSYSSGIEWAVEAGDVVDAASLRNWLASMLADGAGLCDGIFLAQTHRAASSGDHASLAEIVELASAFVTSRERHLETTAQGRAFMEIARAAWNSPSFERLIATCGTTIVYPVAVGLVSAAHEIPLAPTIHAFLHAMTSNWISAGARLIPLGQTDSQRLLGGARAGRGGDCKAGTRRFVGSARQRHLSRRSRQHEA